MMATVTTNRGVAPNSRADGFILEKTWRYFVFSDPKGRTIELHQLTGNGGQLVQIVDGKSANVSASNGNRDQTYANALEHAKKIDSDATEWFR
jgi:hypothetical protein